MKPVLEWLALASQYWPGHGQPAVSGTLGQTQPWLSYGPNNLYPQELIAYRNYSPIHCAVLKLKADLIAGEGWFEHEDHPDWLGDSLLATVAQDYALFSGFALEVIWSRNGQQVASVKPLPFAQIRLAVPDHNAPRFAYLCADWEQYHKRQDKRLAPIKLPLFDPASARSAPRQIYYVADYCPEWPHYPQASYQAALPDILWDYEYAKFRTSQMKRGMFPALHIHVEGEPAEEERQQFYHDLKRKFAGASQAGEVLVTYGYDGAGRTTISPIQANGNADLFGHWAQQASQRIISAHRLSSPALAGLPTAGGMLGGGGNEIAVAYDHFFNTVIRPMQLTICNNLHTLASFGRSLKHEFSISNSKPIRLSFKEELLAQLLTRDELRAELGYHPLNSGINTSIGAGNTVSAKPLTNQTKTQPHE